MIQNPEYFSFNVHVRTLHRWELIISTVVIKDTIPMYQKAKLANIL
jgi:hypothetical protein